jgi:hypothetical protein
VRRLLPPALVNRKAGIPFSVEAYVIVELAFATLFPDPLLSVISVTLLDAFNIIVLLSAASNHNWHPSILIGTKLLVKGRTVFLYG